MIAYYQCKPDTSVVVLSTAHEEAKIVRGSLNPKHKSTIVTEYNRTKCGVDSVDQMSKFYSVKYPTRRWPVQVWSNILNMAGINSHILYKGIHTRKISRYTFLCNLVNDIREFTRPKVIPTPVNPSTPSSSILITRLSLDNSEMTPTTPKRRRMTFNSSSSP